MSEKLSAENRALALAHMPEAVALDSEFWLMRDETLDALLNAARDQGRSQLPAVGGGELRTALTLIRDGMAAMDDPSTFDDWIATANLALSSPLAPDGQEKQEDMASVAGVSCAQERTQTPSPAGLSAIPDEDLGEAIYRALYEHQGGQWLANETKDVWYVAAAKLKMFFQPARELTGMAAGFALPNIAESVEMIREATPSPPDPEAGASVEGEHSTPDQTGPGPFSRLVEREWQMLLDKDDRTSPAEYPDMLLITKLELSWAMAEAWAREGGAK